jgi:radical SAM protein with 4Fe4S-binding SPASM domain
MKFVLQPEFTNNCNFKCTYCPQSLYQKDTPSGNRFDREKGNMTPELFSRFLVNAEKYAKTVLIGYFGEPLLHPQFDEMMDMIPSTRSYIVGLFTNFSLACESNNTIRCLKKCNSVMISLDSTKSAIWEKLCPVGTVYDKDGNPGKDRFKTLTDKIEWWLSIADHTPTQLTYVTTSINEAEREEFVKIWKPRLKNLDSILTKTILSYGGVMYDKRMFQNDCNVIAGDRFTVAWNGDCTPCNLDVNVGLKVGNMNETPDMMDIINTQKWRDTINTIKNKQGICANCFDANNWKEHRITHT